MVKPGFVKIYMPSLGEENLKLPSKFVQSIQGSWPQNVTLRDRYNNFWQVKVKMADGYCYFRDGWTKFIDDNMIEGGDVIAFQYFSHCTLAFKVYGPSACLKKGVGGHRTEKIEEIKIKIESQDDDNTVVGHTTDQQQYYDPAAAAENRHDDHSEINQEQADEDEGFNFFEGMEEICGKYKNDQNDSPKEAKVKEEKKVDKKGIKKEENGEATDGSSTSSTKKRKRNDWYGYELGISGLFQPPINPYFVTRIRKSKDNEIYVPFEVINAFGLKLPDTITFIDPKERKFPAKLKTWSDGRKIYAGGWRNLCQLNIVDDEDSCVCEFADKGSGLCIYVSIIKEQPVGVNDEKTEEA